VEIFFSVDSDGSGQLDQMEFENALERMGTQPGA
jgi:Ca2+-binding EF-hand superfamily protein